MQAQEFPLTPAMQAVVAKNTSRPPGWPLYLVIVVDVLLLAIAAFLLTKPNTLPFALAAIAVGIIVSVAGHFWNQSIKRNAASQLASGTYRQLTGPMRTGKDERTEANRTITNYYLIYGGHRQPIDKNLYDQLVKSKVSWGTVEETPTGHLIFTVRDANGQLVYHHPDYQPEEITAG